MSDFCGMNSMSRHVESGRGGHRHHSNSTDDHVEQTRLSSSSLVQPNGRPFSQADSLPDILEGEDAQVTACGTVFEEVGEEEQVSRGLHSFCPENVGQMSEQLRNLLF